MGNPYSHPPRDMASTKPLDQEVDRELQDNLARQLAADGYASELVHVVLALLAAVLVWRWVPEYDALMWVVAVAVASFGRSVFRRTALATATDGERLFGAIRLGVAATGLAWGAGLLLVGPQLPLETLAWITVLFAGLVSGGATTLLADPRSYYILTGTLLLPVAIAIGMNGQSKTHVVGIVMTLLFGLGMTLFYRRSHQALRRQYREAKRLELTERAAREAREYAERLSSIVEATSDVVFMADAEGRLRYLNSAGREALGIVPEADVTSLTFFDLAPARVRAQVREQALPALLRDGTWIGESTFVHVDGHELKVSMVARVHRSADGAVEAISATARDITEQATARKALKAARDAAEQATAAKSSFLANTSHEIRTPLNGILGMVELLLDTELTAEQRRSVELIATSGETLLNTINDVLDLSKIEAAQLDLESIPFDLHQLLHSSVRLFSARASAKGIELVSDVKPNVPQHVVGDSHRLRQILSNLISNAIKFSAEGEGEVVVTVSAEKTGKDQAQIRFSVRDAGIGIAPENAARIFQPFGQVDASTTRQYGGTGLGLSISRRLVGLMGGTLDVTSALGAGSDFHFELSMRVTERASGGLTAQPVVRLDGTRALVVDDHPVNRRVASEMLRWAHCDVVDVASAEDALRTLRDAAAQGRPYRLVVSDVQMPGRDGFQLAEDIRKDTTLRGVTVMLLSSAARRGDNDLCKQLGVAAYLQKPVSRVELLEAATTAMRDPTAAHRPSLVTRLTIDELRTTFRVLVAEDNKVNQEVATAMLRKRGHDVVVVGDGRAAVDAIAASKSQPFDVVLMDIQMPEMDGVEATREIREKHDASIRIIALTANVSADERERCLAAGMNGYLTKPFKPHELFAAVEGWDEVGADEDKNTLDQTPPVDLVALRAVLADAGIESVANQMLTVFLDDAEPRLAELASAVRAGTGNAIARAAHAFKSGAGNIRATHLAQLLQDAEAAGLEGSIADARELLPSIEREFTRVAEYLRAELKAA